MLKLLPILLSTLSPDYSWLIESSATLAKFNTSEQACVELGYDVDHDGLRKRALELLTRAAQQGMGVRNAQVIINEMERDELARLDDIREGAMPGDMNKFWQARCDEIARDAEGSLYFRRL